MTKYHSPRYIPKKKPKQKRCPVKLLVPIIFMILALVWACSLILFGSSYSGRYSNGVIDEGFINDVLSSNTSSSPGSQSHGGNDDEAVSSFGNENKVEGSSNDNDKDDDGENDEYDVGNKEGSTYLTSYGDHRAIKSISKLPGWIQEYIKWNREVTSRPKDEEHKNKYLVLMCLPDDNSCGGLSDRFRGIFFYLFIAKITNRILCFYWTRPFTLETFLEPTSVGIRWSCPADLPSLVNHDVPTGSQSKFRVYYWHDCQKTPRHEAQELIPCLQRELRNIENSTDDRFAVTRLYGNTVEGINHLNMFAQMYSYKDFMPYINQWQHPDVIHDLFRVLFKPKKHLARRVNATMTKFGLVEDEFVSVHVRVRYPVRIFRTGKKSFRLIANQIDKHGDLPFEGGNKNYLIGIMNNALECGHMLAPNLPIYFATDHNNATNYIISQNKTFTDGKVIQPFGRQSDKMPVHVGIREFQKFDPSDYYSVWEDLLIMGSSRCVAHGVGSFGSFGAGLTGNKCRAVHRKYTGQAETCPNDRGVSFKMRIQEDSRLFPEIGDEWGGKIECNDKYTVVNTTIG